MGTKSELRWLHIFLIVLGAPLLFLVFSIFGILGIILFIAAMIILNSVIKSTHSSQSQNRYQTPPAYVQNVGIGSQKFCTDCGNSNIKDAQYCNRCGKKFLEQTC
jgi:uncharacterized SAM-binding protein YcdF (DUF218 family)